MRGLPGSGKSYWVDSFIETLEPEVALQVRQQGYFSTDSFFMRGEHYIFDKTRLSEYHQRNLAAFIDALVAKVPVVICDNTNLAQWEYLCYDKAARALGYQIRQVLIGDPADPEHQQICAKRNRHGVPLDKIRAMARQYCVF
ncbi:AAA family ATPase [Shewanella sp. GXUN23E]|uniref:AAA family ATPase n=1 Tax=Shewanella sp. GXUN23E TaxID=3422498 RepID=UPI003D7F1495